ncbi:hypothetical protein Tco_0643868 [Tanacetum coccineum]
MQDDPFVNNVHGSESSSLASVVVTRESSSVHSAMNLPSTSGLDNTCLIRWSMMIMIGAANEVNWLCFALETNIRQKDKKRIQKRQNQARNGRA